jgi:hypothetical protein
MKSAKPNLTPYLLSRTGWWMLLLLEDMTRDHGPEEAKRCDVRLMI